MVGALGLYQCGCIDLLSSWVFQSSESIHHAAISSFNEVLPRLRQVLGVGCGVLWRKKGNCFPDSTDTSPGCPVHGLLHTRFFQGCEYALKEIHVETENHSVVEEAFVFQRSMPGSLLIFPGGRPWQSSTTWDLSCSKIFRLRALTCHYTIQGYPRNSFGTAGRACRARTQLEFLGVLAMLPEESEQQHAGREGML